MGDGGDEGNECMGEKCDIPDEPQELSCNKRRSDSFNPNRVAFTSDVLRWSCTDVEEVTLSDRGQEYCEYFSVVNLPPEFEGGETPEPALLGLNMGTDSSYGSTPTSLDLTSNQLLELEADPEAIVGECVFTSWNSDVDTQLDCEDGDDCLELPADTFQMRFGVNSREAAELLIDDCTRLLPPQGDESDPEDPLHDDFFRGCMLNAEINDTQWRKSDSIICSASARLADCGCSVDDGTPFDKALVPQQTRGFVLGGWEAIDTLPSGCRYLDDGDNTVVACGITATEVINNSYEVKELCRQKYADDVVVHVSVPPEAVSCSPDLSQPYTDSCSEEPWVLQP